MSAVTKPIILDETFSAKMDALNHLISHQNAAIDLLASDKRASLVTDVATVATLCKNGEILEVMDYGDQIAPAWSYGTDNYNPALNLCHEADAEIEDQETIHGAFFEWDKTLPVGIPFDQPEAIYYCDGTEGTGDHYITVGAAYGSGWTAGLNIQVTFSVAPAADDQLVIDCGTNNANNPAGGRTWNLYAKGSTTSKDSGTTSSGTNGTQLGTTHSTDPQRTNGRINAPARVCYGYNRWSQSGLRQYLNAIGTAGTWWSAQNPWDRPISIAATADGFLAGYEDATRRYFKPIKVVTVTSNDDDNVEDVTYDKVFLSSLEQMYCVPQFAGKEGDYWEYYKRLLGRTTPAPASQTYARLIKYALNAPTSAQTCFRRSALRTYSYYVWTVSTSGYVTATYAYNAFRCAPSVFLSD